MKKEKKFYNMKIYTNPNSNPLHIKAGYIFKHDSKESKKFLESINKGNYMIAKNKILDEIRLIKIIDIFGIYLELGYIFIDTGKTMVFENHNSLRTECLVLDKYSLHNSCSLKLWKNEKTFMSIHHSTFMNWIFTKLPDETTKDEALLVFDMYKQGVIE